MAETALGVLVGPEYRYELCAGKVAIGRAPDNDICLEPKTISSRHAMIEFALPRTGHLPRDGAVLYDLGSTNGTWVNEQHIKQGSIPLESGDIIRFGYDVDWYRFFYAADMDVAVRGSANLPGDLGAFNAGDRPLKDFAGSSKKANTLLTKPDTKKPPAVLPAPVSKSNLTSRQKPDPGPTGPALVRRSQANPQTSPRRSTDPPANRSPRKSRPSTQGGSPDKSATTRPGVQYPPFPRNSSTLVPAPEKASLEESVAKSAAAGQQPLDSSLRRQGSAPVRIDIPNASGRGAAAGEPSSSTLSPHGNDRGAGVGMPGPSAAARREGPAGGGAGPSVSARMQREELDRMEAAVRDIQDRNAAGRRADRVESLTGSLRRTASGGGVGEAAGAAAAREEPGPEAGGAEAALRQLAANTRHIEDRMAELGIPPAGPSAAPPPAPAPAPAPASATANAHAATSHAHAAPAPAPTHASGPKHASSGPREVDTALFPVADGIVNLRQKVFRLRLKADGFVGQVCGQKLAPPSGDPSRPSCDEVMTRPLAERPFVLAEELQRVERLLPERHFDDIARAFDALRARAEAAAAAGGGAPSAGGGLPAGDWARSLAEAERSVAFLRQELALRDQEVGRAREEAAAAAGRAGVSDAKEIQAFLAERGRERELMLRHIEELERRDRDARYRWSSLLQENRARADEALRAREQVGRQGRQLGALLEDRDRRIAELTAIVAEYAGGQSASRKRAAEYLVQQMRALDRAIEEAAAREDKLEEELRALAADADELRRRAPAGDAVGEARLRELEDEVLRLQMNGSSARVAELQASLATLHAELARSRPPSSSPAGEGEAERLARLQRQREVAASPAGPAANPAFDPHNQSPGPLPPVHGTYGLPPPLTHPVSHAFAPLLQPVAR